MIFDCRISDKLQKSQDLKESQNWQKSQNSDGKKCIIAGSWSLAHIHSQGLENTLFDSFLVNSIQERFFSLFSRDTWEREDHYLTSTCPSELGMLSLRLKVIPMYTIRQSHYKLDWVGQLMTDPPPTTSTTLHSQPLNVIDRKLQIYFHITLHSMMNS